MKLVVRFLVVAIILLPAAAYAQTPATQPVDTTSFTPQEVGIIEDLDVPAGMSVAELLQLVQRKAPSFQYVAEPGDWQKHPLPQMKLHSVMLQQIVEVISNLVPNVKATTVLPYPPVYVFHSLANRTGAAAPETQLGTFGLGEPVEELGLRAAWAALGKDQEAPTAEEVSAGRKRALKDVLSLLESAASEADHSAEPSLKLHEETEVLLVRGTPQQIEAVSRTLQALQSHNQAFVAYRNDYAHLAEAYQKARATLSNLKDQEDRALQANRSIGNRVSELEKENAALRSEIRRATSDKNGGADEKH
ncbi:MAG TPA: hypothetical protein VGI81_05550 [Tepidisphaeraceae bacterium]